jgi:hypothetical protein
VRRPNLAGVAIDFATLPELAPARPESNVTFSFSTQRTKPQCSAGGIPVPYDGWVLHSSFAPRTLLDVEGVPMPLPELDGTLDELDDRLSKSATAPGKASWTSVLPSGDDGANVDIARWAGTFDRASHAGRATTRSSVHPSAIVPGAVYAFRACRAGCDRALGDAARTDTLAIVAPPAVWLSSSNVQGDARLLHEWFTFEELEVRPGAAASLDIVYLRVAIAALHNEISTGKHLPTDGPQETTPLEMAEVDVVWSDGPSPEITLFAGPVAAQPVQVVPGPTGASAPHCHFPDLE